ncbi:MAG: hypothetical protein QXJ17_08045 [Nitrososphaeria archaeon]
MRSELIKIHEKVQTTFIYVTHDQIEAMTLSNKIALMNKGRIVQYDTPLNIYNNTVDMFVASFVGSPSINFFKGKIAKDTQNQYLFEGEDFSYVIPSSVTVPDNLIGQNIILGVRPEDFLVTKSNKAMGIKTSIYTRELRGGETILSLKFKETLAKVKVEPESPLKSGDDVLVKIKKAYFFDDNSRLITDWRLTS